MSRLFPLGVLVLGLAGLGMPARAQAQFMMYDMYTPYSSYYYGAPYTTSYAPGIGCGCSSACSPCGCAPCGGCATGCATGNCASGNCATGNCAVTTNLSPSGTLTPVPENNSSTRSIESRLQALERAVLPNQNPPRRTYDSTNPGNGTGTGTTRPRTAPADNFESPLAPNRPQGDAEMFEPRSNSESFRVPLPGETTEESVIPSRRPAAPPAIEDNSNGTNPTTPTPGTTTPTLGTPTDSTSPSTALPLETRLTSRAVSPRQRLSISVGFAKTSTARTTAPRPAPVNVARN